MPLRVYDETIRVLKSAVHAAKLGREEELGAIKRLNEQTRLVERYASGPPVEELIAEERRLSHSYGGRSVFGWAKTEEISEGPGQSAHFHRTSGHRGGDDRDIAWRALFAAPTSLSPRPAANDAVPGPRPSSAEPCFPVRPSHDLGSP